MVEYIKELDIYVDKTTNVDKVKHKLDEYDDNVYVRKHTSIYNGVEHVCMSVFIPLDETPTLFEWLGNEQDIKAIVIGG